MLQNRNYSHPFFFFFAKYDFGWKKVGDPRAKQRGEAVF